MHKPRSNVVVLLLAAPQPWDAQNKVGFGPFQANRDACLQGSSTERSHAIEAPPLPTESPVQAKSEKEDMQDFLDDLLG